MKRALCLPLVLLPLCLMTGCKECKESDSPDFCADRGIEYMQRHKPDQAEKALEEACSRGSGKGCDAGSVFYFGGYGRPKDEVKAVSLLKRACELEHGMGCAKLGQAYDRGIGVPIDSKLAGEFYKKACARGADAACERIKEIGVIFQEQLNGGADLIFTVSAADCDKGNDKACFLMGVAHATGRGVSWNSPRAAQFFDKGCQSGSAEACNNLGRAYLFGTGVEEDKDRAKSLFQKACEQKNQSACFNMKIM